MSYVGRGGAGGDGPSYLEVGVDFVAVEDLLAVNQWPATVTFRHGYEERMHVVRSLKKSKILISNEPGNAITVGANGLGLALACVATGEGHGLQG